MAKMEIPIGDMMFSVNDHHELKDAVQAKYQELEKEIATLDGKLDKLRQTRMVLSKFLGLRRSKADAEKPTAKEGEHHAQG